MNRRRFLAGGVAGMAFVAGCVSGGPGSGGPEIGTETSSSKRTTMRAGDPATNRATGRATRSETVVSKPQTSETVNEISRTSSASATETPAETDGSTDAGEIQRRVSLAGVDNVPAKYGVNIDVELLESTVTPAHTARLRVTTTNEGRKRKISIAGGPCDLFNRTGGLSEKPGLMLKPPKDTKWIDRKGDRWVRDRPSDQPRNQNSYGCLSREYPHGDSVSNDYLVWDDYRVSGYMTTGTYRFAEPVSLKSANAGITTKPTAEFTWGFSLAVEKP